MPATTLAASLGSTRTHTHAGMMFRSPSMKMVRDFFPMSAMGCWPTWSAIIGRVRGSVRNAIGRLYRQMPRLAASSMTCATSSPNAIGTIPVVGDLAWPYRDHDRPHGGVRSRYERMFMPEILEMGPLVQQVAKLDAYLALWAPWGFLEEVFQVIRAWGFQFAYSGMTWHKQGKMGCGSYFRLEDEFLVLGKRGNPPPFADRGIRNVLATLRGEHSEKPVEIYDILRRTCPGPFLELFGRETRPGWDVCLGNSFKRKLPNLDEGRTD